MKNVHYKKVAVCNQKKRSENHFSYLAVDGVWHLLILRFFSSVDLHPVCN